MRSTKIYFLLTFVMLLSASSHARKIVLDDITNKELIKQDDVERQLYNALLVEKHRDAATKEWTIKIFSLESELSATLAANHEIRSSQIVASVQKLEGMDGIALKDISGFTVSADVSQLLFTCGKDLFTYAIDSGVAHRLTTSARAKEEWQFSPDGSLVSYIEDFNLWVVDRATTRARKLTDGGHEKLLFGKLDWVYQEEIFGRGNFRGYWWSPDSQSIAFLKIDEAPVQSFPLADDSTDYGNLRLMSYPKAGTPLPLVDIGIASVASGEISWVDLSPYEKNARLVVGVDFSKDSSQVLYQVQNRTQSFWHLRSHDMRSQKSTTLWEEQSETWVNRLQDSFLSTQNGFYFVSEVSGRGQIYFFANEKNSAHPITQQDFAVTKILSISDDYVYFMANEENLLEDQFFSVDVKSGNVTRLLSQGQHHDVDISANGRFMIATSQSRTSPPKKTLFALKNSTLTILHNLHNVDVTNLSKLDLQSKEYLTIDNRRNQKMQALLFLPSDFDESRRYPVMTFVYCGPKIPVVKNRFMVSHELWHHYLAQEGYVVLMMDCHSANSIGHDGESVVYKKLGVAELEDIEDGIAFLKQKSWVDADRIGLWGWSYGGFMTSFAMTRAELFKVGIAVAPVTDWRLYDSVYTERYMCTPEENQAGFDCSSVLKRANALNGQLLLVHGAMDDNVHQQNSLRLAYEMQKSGKTNVQQIIYLQNEHSLTGVRKHLFATMKEFIFKHL